MLGKLPFFFSCPPKWQPLEYQFYAMVVRQDVRWLWHVPPSHGARDRIGGPSTVRTDRNGWTRPKTKLATHRWQNFIQNFQRCIRQIFWYIFPKDWGPSQKTKAWTCEHVFALVFTDSGHQNFVQWRWVARAGLLACKMVTLFCTENVQAAGHNSFVSVICLSQRCRGGTAEMSRAKIKFQKMKPKPWYRYIDDTTRYCAWIKFEQHCYRNRLSIEFFTVMFLHDNFMQPSEKTKHEMLTSTTGR